MKLNPNCVKGILLVVEESSDFSNNFNYSMQKQADKEYPLLAKFTHKEIIYHILQCFDAGLITKPICSDDMEILIVRDLTSSGHEFVSSIRNNKIWNRIMKKGISTLPILIEVTKDIALKYFMC